MIGVLQPARSFIGERLAGVAPLETVFWRDMLLVGTTLTLVSFVTALVLAANGAPPPVTLGVYLIALPYTIFIANAVWRASRHVQPIQRITVRTITAVWLVIALVL